MKETPQLLAANYIFLGQDSFRKEQSCLKTRSSGLWHRTVLWRDMNLSKVPAVSIFTFKMDLWNVDVLPAHYTASRSRWPQLEYSPSWKHQDSQHSWLVLGLINVTICAVEAILEPSGLRYHYAW